MGKKLWKNRFLTLKLNSYFQVISIHRSKEEIAEFGMGFMVHDKQIRSLCGPIRTNEEQLFGYEVIVYRKTSVD